MFTIKITAMMMMMMMMTMMMMMMMMMIVYCLLSFLPYTQNRKN